MFGCAAGFAGDSAAYTSLSHRLPDIKHHLVINPQDVVASLMDLVVNGRSAARDLGFSEDLLLRSGWISEKCCHFLDLPKSVAKRQVQQCNPAHSVPELLDGESDRLQGAPLCFGILGSTACEQTCAAQHVHYDEIQDLNWSVEAIAAKCFSRRVLQLGLGARVRLACHLGRRRHGFARSRSDAAQLRDLLAGAGSALADEFVAAFVTHEMPSRFPRTHVDGEASLSGMWFIQLHNLVDVSVRLRRLIVSLQAAMPGNVCCQSAPLTLRVSHLSLEQLLAIWVWEADTSEVLHRFDNQFLARASAPEDMRDDLQTALEMLFSCTHGRCEFEDCQGAGISC